MKTKSIRNRWLTLAALLCLAWGVSTVSAQTPLSLTYDATTNGNPGWFAPGAWTDNDTGLATDWVPGSFATINRSSTTTVAIEASTTVAGLDSTGTGNMTIAGSEHVAITLDGGTVGFNGYVTMGAGTAGVAFQGDYTLNDGLTWMRAESNTINRYVGTATIAAGTLDLTANNIHLGASSNFIVTGSNAQITFRSNDGTMGSLALNNGTALLGRPNADNSFTLTVSSLSGTSASATIASANAGSNALRTLVVDQSTVTTYAGKIEGAAPGGNRLALTMQGSGDLSLSGQIDLRRTTTVSEGRLYINGTNTAFSDEVGSTAIHVDGGTLGGTGTINVGENDNVVLAAGGQLAAGLEGSAGRTTYALDGGVLDLTAATGSAGTGWLKFDLGSADTAGTTYDQILITNGTLNIGTGLNFDAFDFNPLEGFAPGTYVLFDTPVDIIGSLGTATGTVGGYDATLSFNSPSLVLTVIPEPGSVALLLAGAALLAARRRRG